MQCNAMARAKKCLAQQGSTNSKHYFCDPENMPKYWDYGYGPHIYHGRDKYLDLTCGLGTSILGYGHSGLDDFVYRNPYRGGCIGGNLRQEIVVAELIKENFPVDLVKFVNSGTEACIAAIRMARSYTGKMKVFSAGYHGWSDEFVSLTKPASGVMPHPCIEPLDRGFWRTNHEDTACVIVEPVIDAYDKQRVDWLKKLIQFCNDLGIVVIFDEVVTGMRFWQGSVSKKYNLRPDIICLGKALGNGYKVACVAGDHDVLSAPYFVSGSYSAHYHSLLAAEYILKNINHKNIYMTSDLCERGKAFIESFNKIEPSLIRIKGWGAKGSFDGEWLDVCVFRQELAKARIFTKHTLFFNFDNIEYTEIILDISSQILHKMRTGKVSLEGRLPLKPLQLIVRKGDDNRERKERGPNLYKPD